MSPLDQPILESATYEPSALQEISFPQVAQIERQRQSKVLVLAASMLEMEFLPQLYDTLLEIGHCKRLDVVLYGRGGEINAARRIALLLHRFTDHLGFIVPYHCASACTILAMSGHQIIAGDLALFSPIDPRLNADESSGEDAPGALASEDIRLFCKMSEDWFDVKGEQVRGELLGALAGSIFPSTLTSLYRSTLEAKDITLELLKFQLPHDTEQKREAIVSHLLSDYHSHSYAISGENLAELGLNIYRDSEVENLAWKIADKLREVVGGAVRKTPMDPRNDVLIADAVKVSVRQRYPNTIAPVWTSISTKVELAQ